MLLSELIPKMDENIKFKIINEKEFSALGLVVSENNEDSCSFLDSEEFADSINDNIKMLIVDENMSQKVNYDNFGLCIVEEPRLTFFKLHNFLSESEHYKRENFKSIVGDNCSISPMCSISTNNVVIGNNVVLEEFVVIRENTFIGDNSIIRAGSIIGGEGFEVKRDKNKLIPVKHLGGVIIGQNVEVKHNVVIDKAVYPWDDTTIGDESKIDSLVEIAHGVKISECVMIIASASIFGRTKIMSGCRIGPGSIIRNGITLENDVNVSLGSVVTKSVEKNKKVTGNFAIEHSNFIQNFKKNLN